MDLNLRIRTRGRSLGWLDELGPLFSQQRLREMTEHAQTQGTGSRGGRWYVPVEWWSGREFMPPHLNSIRLDRRARRNMRRRMEARLTGNELVRFLRNHHHENEVTRLIEQNNGIRTQFERWKAWLTRARRMWVRMEWPLHWRLNERHEDDESTTGETTTSSESTDSGSE